MRFAMHKVGETAITQILEAPEHLIAEITPEGVISVPVGSEVSAGTHAIVDGNPVLIQTSTHQ